MSSISTLIEASSSAAVLLGFFILHPSTVLVRRSWSAKPRADAITGGRSTFAKGGLSVRSHWSRFSFALEHLPFDRRANRANA
jgi:hypothetical protein